MNMAKRYASNEEAYEMYLSKAEEVDMSFCKTLKKDQEIIQQSRRSRSHN
jgi:hypothetical protein